MATSDLSAWCVSQLKIVLLGGRNSGKSSVGNLILGKEEFVTRERTSCSRRLGLAARRWLTVVDTPGWWCDFSARDTSMLVKREITSSVSLCSPGPHAFLITVKPSSVFSEKRRRAVEEHVGLLGEEVWSYCMVVFTSEVGCKRKEEQPGLRWLTEKCSHRCHTLVSVDDVTELLEKIQKLVMENGNRVFEMQENIRQATAEEKRKVEERAQQRFLKMKTHRSLMKEILRPITDIRIVLLGAKGSGKTSTLNTILGRDSGQPLRRTAQCMVGRGLVFGRQLTVVDTPGWWMNYFSDESSIFDRRQLVLSLSLCPPGPHVFLLVVRLDRAFTESYRRAVQEHLQLISEHIWSRVIVLLTFGDWLEGTTAEQCIESEGEPLRWVIDRCGNRYHVVNNKTRGDGFQVRELIWKIEETVAGCGGGGHYEVGREATEQMEEKMRRDEERAEERVMRKEEQRQMVKSQLAEKLNSLSEMRLVLIGGRKTGKSSCGNTILRREAFCTDTLTSSCSEQRAKITSKTVAVLDTPGCFSVTSDLLVPACALLLVINVSCSFRDTDEETLEKQLEAGGVGGCAWSRAIILFSHGDWLGDTSVERRIESEGGPLQRLVEKCGNRYHVLDNTNQLDGAQVDELMELIEAMLVNERLDVVHKGDRVWKSVCSATATLRKKNVKLSRDSTESAICPGAKTSGASSDNGGQIVARTAGRVMQTGLSLLNRDTIMSCLSSMLCGKHRLRWTLNLPVWFSEEHHLRLNGDSPPHLFSSRPPKMLLTLPETQHRTPAEEDAISVASFCHPLLRERALQRLGDSGGLQALIDRGDHSSLEDLEAFIDWYFEMVLEQTMDSWELTDPEQHSVVEETGHDEVLSSINRKLSKLELLDDIRKDLAELRTSLESSWKAIEELREKFKQA